METTGILSNNSLNLSLEDGIGGWIFGLAFAASIGAFVFANVVYTPEILEGAKDLRRSERETEISKILQAVQAHITNGKDVNELRIPLETALGKSLEDYVTAVLESENDDEYYSVYTTTDHELATLLKQSLIL